MRVEQEKRAFLPSKREIPSRWRRGKAQGRQGKESKGKGKAPVFFAEGGE